MGIVLAGNQYGKAQTRLVRLSRDGDRHQLADLNVSTRLAGNLAATHLTGEWLASGLTELVLLNSTGSEFTGFAKDRYTTLPETTDRILATAVDARWRHAGVESDWAASYVGVRDALIAGFVETYSRSLQQTLYAMGRRALTQRPELVEIRLSLPNRHHLPVDLQPFGLADAGEVFVAADRPYGLIDGTVTRDDAPPPGSAW